MKHQVILIILFLFCGILSAQTRKDTINLVKVREELVLFNKNFAEDFKKKDSLALAAYYAENGTWGSVKGRENLITAWHQMIQSVTAEEMPFVKFTITSVCPADDFIVETGVYEMMDKDLVTKNKGKYLVVRKWEDGEWKIYRDIGL